MKPLSVTTTPLDTIQVITGLGEGFQGILITHLCSQLGPLRQWLLRAQPASSPCQASSGPLSASNRKPVVTQACQLLLAAIRVAREFPCAGSFHLLAAFTHLRYLSSCALRLPGSTSSDCTALGNKYLMAPKRKGA